MPGKAKSLDILTRALEVTNAMETMGVSDSPADMQGLTYQALKLVESSKIIDCLNSAIKMWYKEYMNKEFLLFTFYVVLFILMMGVLTYIPK